MKNIIQLLPETLINQIAAGEVVERPASVVKELLENAVDAGASHIQADIAQSGKSAIRLSDNGRGMTKEDLLLAVERHATSKIRGYEDLMALKTMGFRGEALPSIAAVSRMTITTVPEGESSGHRLEIWGGKKMGLQETGGPSGTVVEVVELFYNTPARMAFLKSPRVEWSQIQTALERVALGFPGLRFDLIHNSKKVLHLFPNGDPAVRLADLWGPEISGSLIPIDFFEDHIRISGFLSPPHHHWNTARHIAFIVNQRWVRSPLLYPLVLRTYAGMLPSGRYPAAALWLEVPPELIDVNIHPFKQEVRFSQTAWIQRLVSTALSRALKTHVPPTAITERPGTSPTWGSNPEQPLLFREASWIQERVPVFPEKVEATEESQEEDFVLKDGRSADASGVTLPASTGEGEPAGFSRLNIISQLQGTYLLGILDGGLLLIDQHAAHERILYERFLSQWRGGGVSSQYLLVPILMDLPPQWDFDWESLQTECSPLGFEVAPAGGNSVWIKSIPLGLTAHQAEEAFREILEKMRNEHFVGNREGWYEAMVKLLACHSAIRAGQVLTHDEIRSLLVQLDQTESPSHCPHGRPLWLLISWDELEKRFKRK